MKTLKTLLPSLIPILTLIGASVSPAIQHAIAAAALTHPWISSTMLVIGYVVNHFLPAPGSQPASFAAGAR